MPRPLLSRALPLAGALLAAPLVLGMLPGAAADPGGNGNGKGRPDGKGKPSVSKPVEQADARVVVAVIDSSMNPYHEFFQVEQSSVTPDVLAEFGIGESQIITLTRTGDFEADYAADKERVWDKIERGKPYWFTGTNIIATTFEDLGEPEADPVFDTVFGPDAPERPILPDHRRDTHGVGTTAAVLAANPEAIAVLVEGINDESETWAFTHPAVDIITTSYGFPGSLPFPFHLKDSYTGVVELGKVHTGAADNSPALSPPDGTSGPWWTLGIAGFQEGTTEGRQTLSGNAIDFVGDFTQTLPYCWDCESGGERSVSGTSFATPRSAGTISSVILEARRATGHVGGIVTEGVEQPALVASNGTTLTTWQLRRALEEAAYFPTTGDFSPGGSLFDVTSAPVNDVAPYAQVGWGALTPDPEHGVIAETLAQLGFGGEPTRTKTADNCAFQTANIEARQLYWDRVAFESESFGTNEDPFIYC